jgi:probable lipoprotein
LKLESKVFGQISEQFYNVKVDQKKKTIQPKNGKGGKMLYKISGDVLTLDISNLDSSSQADVAISQKVKFKRTN